MNTHHLARSFCLAEDSSVVQAAGPQPAASLYLYVTDLYLDFN